MRGHIRNSPPLYQISYLMGALQLWSVYQDVVVQKKAMTIKQFNDRVIRTGSMPIEMVRALLTNQPLTRDYRAQWKFYGDVGGQQVGPDVRMSGGPEDQTTERPDHRTTGPIRTPTQFSAPLAPSS